MTIKVISIDMPNPAPHGVAYVCVLPTTSIVTYDTDFEHQKLFMAAIKTALIYHSGRFWCVRERKEGQSFLLQEIRLPQCPEGCMKKPHISFFIRT